MSVKSFDPSASQQTLDAQCVAKLLEQANQLDPNATEKLQLEEGFAEEFQFTAVNAGWADVAQSLADAELVALIRFYTWMEQSHPTWQAGAKSPVVVMVRVLKSRQAYPSDLTRWIKAHTENKFLPHGSLADLL